MSRQQPATREEVIAKYVGEKVSFEHWAREVLDRRTWNGVRHIKITRSTCRLVDGVPVVRYRGDDYELKATRVNLDDDRFIVALASIK